MSYETLFAYPSKNNNDINVYTETINTITYYHISIEGCILYSNLQDGIKYLITLKDKYHEWLCKNHRGVLTKHSSPPKPVYKTYDISIYTRPECDNYVEIYLKAPMFLDIYDTYVWLDGAINQIKEYELKEKICA